MFIKIKFKFKYIFIILLLLILMVLFNGIFFNYAFSDTYEFVWNARNTDFINVFVQDGRVVYGIINKLIYSNINTIGELKYIRFFSLIALFLFSIYLYSLLIKNNITKINALFILFLFLASPFAGIVIHWEILCPEIWACLLALLAGNIAYNALLKRKEIYYSKLLYLLFLSGVLGVLALCIYQPAYPFFIIPAFLFFINTKKIKGNWMFLCFHFLLYVIYFIIFNAILYITEIPSIERSGIAFTGSKVTWFVGGALFRSFQHSFIFCNEIIIYIVCFITVAFLFYYIFRRIKNLDNNKKMDYIFILMLFYCLSYLPNLISVENSVSYRTMGTLIFITSFLFISALSEIQHYRGIAVILQSLVVLLALLSAYYNNHHAVAKIQSDEYTAVKEVSQKQIVKGLPESIAVIQSKGDLFIKKKIILQQVTDEFGIQSNSRDWVPEPFIRQLLFELTGNREKAKRIPVMVYNSKNPVNDSITKRALVIDVDKIVEAYYSKQDK